MPGVKKFRLSHRKGRKPVAGKNLVVAIPREFVDVFPVRIRIDSSYNIMKLTSHQVKLPAGWTLVDSSKILLAKCLSSDMHAVTSFSVIIEENFGWSIVLPRGIPIPRDSYIFSLFPFVCDTETIVKVLHAVDGASMCEGNPDEKFQCLKQWKAGRFIGRGKSNIAAIAAL